MGIITVYRALGRTRKNVGYDWSLFRFGLEFICKGPEIYFVYQKVRYMGSLFLDSTVRGYLAVKIM